MKKEVLLIAVLILLVGTVFAETQQLQTTLKATVLPLARIHSPNNGSILDNRQVLFFIGANGKATMKYSEDNKFPIPLCTNCNMYSKTKPFDDGQHNITFYFTFKNFNTFTKNISFIVDSRKPIITATEPQKGFANGIFIVKFQEANPIELILDYGNNKIGFKKIYLDFNKCKEEKLTKTCIANVNLSEYDQQDIIYKFSIKDILNRKDESTTKTLGVDFKAPIVSSLDYKISKNKVDLSLKIDEKNLDNVVYKENLKGLLRFFVSWKILCTKLDKNNLCRQSLSFQKGKHDLTIKVLDKAGNSLSQDISFNIN